MKTKHRRVAAMLDIQMPFKRHADLFAGVADYARQHDWHVIIDEFADETIRRGGHYDGVIARATRKLEREGSGRGVPVVNVWASSPASDSLPGVFPDWRALGRFFAEHLLERGFQRFAAIVIHRDRRDEISAKAFADTVATAGGSCLTTVLPSTATLTARDWRTSMGIMKAAMNDWEPPIGVYTGHDFLGRLVAQMSQVRGWRVPQDVGIAAGMNEETMCEYPKPSLTSMEVGFRRIGFAAAQLLDRLMDHRKARTTKRKQQVREPEQIILPPERLVIRESTDFFLVDEPSVAAAMAFIGANYQRPIGPNDVARAVATHPRTLTNRFHQHLGRTIAQEILRVRFERAKRELAEPKRSIKAIALASGFSSRLRMTDAFARKLGMTPTEYRRRCRFDPA